MLEDDAVMLRAWVKSARRKNVPVVACATVEEAMEALSCPGAAGLITDFHLENGTSMPAIGLARRLAPPLPVSVATGNGGSAQSALDDEGLEAEVQSKPVDMPDVLDRIWHRRSLLP